jgi:hypothetical protein
MRYFRFPATRFSRKTLNSLDRGKFGYSSPFLFSSGVKTQRASSSGTVFEQCVPTATPAPGVVPNLPRIVMRTPILA